MSGPARAGALLYASDIERLATFYEKLLNMSRRSVSAERIVLASPDFQLIVHALPPALAASVQPQSPAQPRAGALRLFFTVPSLADASALASTLGGAVFTERYPGPGGVVANAADPEGNIFQLRENLS